MNQFENKEIIQAVLIADNSINFLRPLSSEISTALIPLVNVPLLDYALECLNRSRVEEVFIFSSLYINDVREHIKQRIESKCSWSVNMKVEVIGSEGTRCVGDVLRDLDAKAFIRGHFILMGADTVCNVNLIPILENHKKTAKFDKGCALTIIAKEDPSELKTGDQIIIAMDSENKRLHFHQRIKQNSKENKITMPLEIFLNNSNIELHHNLIDPQIAICSPTFLSLFSDNFDFENRDDFIRGILINEEILDSRIYVHLLKGRQYARKITNWMTYQIVSNDIINRWAYPLVPDMGVCCLFQNYYFLRNNVYKSPKANICKVAMKNNIVIQAYSSIDNESEIENVVIGKNCKIGKNCILNNVFLFDNVTVKDNCHLEYCIIGSNSTIEIESKLNNGVIIGSNVTIPKKSNISNKFIQKNSRSDEDSEKIGDDAFVINDEEIIYASDSDDGDIETSRIGIPKIGKLEYVENDQSDYESSSEEEEESRENSPIPDDTNIFLYEVIDSLARGFQEKSNPDFLILEINSSRYAYNMSLNEVNYNVIKGMFSLPNIKDAKNTQSAVQNLMQVLKHFNPIITNYIKTEDAMIDCLKAMEECFNNQEFFREKASQIIHYFYDKEFLSEDAILIWYNNLCEESNWLKENLKKLIDWLKASSEESSTESE